MVNVFINSSVPNRADLIRELIVRKANLVKSLSDASVIFSDTCNYDNDQKGKVYNSFPLGKLVTNGRCVKRIAAELFPNQDIFGDSGNNDIIVDVMMTNTHFYINKHIIANSSQCDLIHKVIEFINKYVFPIISLIRFDRNGAFYYQWFQLEITETIKIARITSNSNKWLQNYNAIIDASLHFSKITTIDLSRTFHSVVNSYRYYSIIGNQFPDLNVLREKIKNYGNCTWYELSQDFIKDHCFIMDLCVHRHDSVVLTKNPEIDNIMSIYKTKVRIDDFNMLALLDFAYKNYPRDYHVHFGGTSIPHALAKVKSFPENGEVYALKIQRKKNERGNVKIIKSSDDFARAKKITKPALIVRYIDNPARSLDNKKIHIRMYIGIVADSSSIVRSILFRTGRMFTASEEYVQSNYDNENIHISHFTRTKKNMFFPDDINQTTIDPSFVPAIYEKIKKISIIMTTAMSDKARSYSESTYGIDIIAFDMVIDENYNPVVLSVQYDNVGFNTIANSNNDGVVKFNNTFMEDFLMLMK